MKYAHMLGKLLMALGVLAVLPPSDANAEPPRTPPGFERAAAAQTRHTTRLFENPHVQGTAVGMGEDGSPVVKVYTDESGLTGIPRHLDGVPVAVEVTGKIVALGHRLGHQQTPGSKNRREKIDPTQRFERPVPIGVSTGHPAITAGTIGARVISTLPSGETVYALSNNHVYADSNKATVGVDNVLQPGPFDGGVDSDDAIGTLFDFEPIDFSISGVNVIDAAIALSSTDNLGAATPANGYGLPRTTPMLTPFIGQRVMKYGRTTELTDGVISGLNATVRVAYPEGDAVFVDQIVISGRRRGHPFSAGGDSGSLIVSREAATDRRPVGLLFAGGSFLGTDFTFANPIGPVLTRFQVAIDGQP